MRIGIFGYGNLGRGAESAAHLSADAELVGIFTRRDKTKLESAVGTPIFGVDELLRFKGDIDVLLVCGGSAGDLPKMTPALARHFDLVDSFDAHERVKDHFDAVNAAARETCHTALISAGWDPGLFSLARAYFGSFLHGGLNTFWGSGVSEGHSDAVRKLDGVADAREYTIPSERAISIARSEESCVRALSEREKHRREVYVCAKDGADIPKIDREIKTMPGYFAPYDTSVSFISAEKMRDRHAEYPHGGCVIATGKTGTKNEHFHTAELSLRLSSNPEFTACVMLSFARAVRKMSAREEYGAKTVLDIRARDILSDEEDLFGLV